MDYRNKYYVVLRSRTSAGWDWAVDVDARTVRGGQAASKQAAIKAAEIAHYRTCVASCLANGNLDSGIFRQALFELGTGGI